VSQHRQQLGDSLYRQAEAASKISRVQQAGDELLSRFNALAEEMRQAQHTMEELKQLSQSQHHALETRVA
jgi:flagellar capping protein FliD